MSDTPPSAAPSLWRRIVLAIVGLLIAVVAGGFAFFRPTWSGGPHLVPRVPLHDLATTLAATPLPLILLMLLCTATALPLRALQVRISARAVDGPPRMPAVLRAAGVSIMGQNLLPMKLNEAARFVVLRQDARVPFPVAIAASGVDRAVDSGAMLVVVILVPLALGLPAIHVAALQTVLRLLTAAGIVLFFGILLVLRLHAPLTRLLRSRFPRLAAIVERFGEGANYASTPRRVGLGLANACLIVLCYSAGIFLALRALHIDLPAGSSLIIAAFIFSSSAVPGAPSGVGVFHYAASTAVKLLGASTKDALAFAVLMHAVDVVGTTLAGGLAFSLIPGRPLRWRDLISELPEEPPEQRASAA